jgi:GntR family transcriptional regulator
MKATGQAVTQATGQTITQATGQAPAMARSRRSTTRGGETATGESGQRGYQGIAAILSERMDANVYPPGSRLPSVAQLCTEFGVSPVTVNRALSLLKARGLVSSVKGRGTFARPLDLSDSSFRLRSAAGPWLDDSADIRLISVTMVRADKTIADRLGMRAGQRVVHLKRVVSYDGAPAMSHAEFVVPDPLRPLLESQLQLTSLHAFLDSQRGNKFPDGDLTVRAVNLGAEDAELLQEPEGAAALCLEHLFRDSDGRPVSFGRFLLRGDRFQLNASINPERH